MTQRVIADWDRFTRFLTSQPLCQWSLKKEQEIAQGLHADRGAAHVHPPASAKNDNADLAAALASMA